MKKYKISSDEISEINKIISILYVNPEALDEEYRILNIFYKLKKLNQKECRTLLDPHKYMSIIFSTITVEIQKIYNLKDHDPTYMNVLEIHSKIDYFIKSNVDKKYVIFFLDFKKAFDSIDRMFILYVLRFYNIGQFAFIIAYLNACMYNYNIPGYERYYKKFGIPQGLPFSTYLFSLVVYHITSKYKNYFSVIFRFVDDITICIDESKLSSYKPHLDMMLDEFKQAGLILNLTKTKYKTNSDNITTEFTRITDNTLERCLGKYYSNSDNTFQNFLNAEKLIFSELEFKLLVYLSFCKNVHNAQVLTMSIQASYKWLTKIYDDSKVIKRIADEYEYIVQYLNTTYPNLKLSIQFDT